MARERSPWEGTQDTILSGRTALGRVVYVDERARRCRLKTLGQPGSTDDLDLQNVQWISLASSGEGAEDTCLPHVGQYGVIIFVNSEPYVIGFFQPMRPTGNAPRNEQEVLKSGDRVIKTIFGNSIILRRGGTVELKSTNLCRRLLIPTRNMINDVCQEYELEAAGGYHYWHINRDNGTTNWDLLAYNNLTPTKAVRLQLGSTESGALLDLAVGDSDGTGVTGPLMSVKVMPSGDTIVNTEGNLFATVKGTADIGVSGNLNAAITGNTVITVEGETTLTSTGDVTASTEGSLKATASGGAALSLKEGKVALGSAAAELLDLVKQTLAEVQQHMHPTVVGPSGPPMDAAAFAAIQSKVESIMGSL